MILFPSGDPIAKLTWAADDRSHMLGPFPAWFLGHQVGPERNWKKARQTEKDSPQFTGPDLDGERTSLGWI